MYFHSYLQCHIVVLNTTWRPQQNNNGNMLFFREYDVVLPCLGDKWQITNKSETNQSPVTFFSLEWAFVNLTKFVERWWQGPHEAVSNQLLFCDFFPPYFLVFKWTLFQFPAAGYPTGVKFWYNVFKTLKQLQQFFRLSSLWDSKLDLITAGISNEWTSCRSDGSVIQNVPFQLEKKSR